MIALLLTATALAGSVYINGVRADVLPAATLRNVTVQLDPNGDVWIDAPQYRVEAIPEDGPSTGATRASPPPAQTVAPTTPPPPPAADQVSGWWLVTEDHQSMGQALAITINGAPVYRVASGQPAIVLDLSPYLHRGTNEIRIEPVANGVLGGGALTVYVGRGQREAGAIRIDQPSVFYSREATSPVGSRTYTVTLP